jgi:hypothetical protein
LADHKDSQHVGTFICIRKLHHCHWNQAEQMNAPPDYVGSCSQLPYSPHKNQLRRINCSGKVLVNNSDIHRAICDHSIPYTFPCLCHHPPPSISFRW